MHVQSKLTRDPPLTFPRRPGIFFHLGVYRTIAFPAFENTYPGGAAPNDQVIEGLNLEENSSGVISDIGF